MRLARLVLYSNILLIAGLILLVLIKLNVAPQQTQESTQANHFPIESPELNLEISGEPAKLIGKKAKIELGEGSNVLFEKDVELHYNKKIIKPVTLKYTFDTDEIIAFDLVLEGQPLVNIGEANLAPNNRQDILQELQIEGSFPISEDQQLTSLKAKKILGRLKTLDLLNKNKEDSLENQKISKAMILILKRKPKRKFRNLPS